MVPNQGGRPMTLAKKVKVTTAAALFWECLPDRLTLMRLRERKRKGRTQRGRGVARPSLLRLNNTSMIARSPAAATPREDRLRRRALGTVTNVTPTNSCPARKLTPKAKPLTPGAKSLTPKAEPLTPRAEPLTPRAKPLTPMAITPSPLENTIDEVVTSPVPLKIFGETGILELTRGPAPPTISIFGVEGILQDEPGLPPPSPEVAWPSEWPEDWWDEEDEWWDGATWAAWDGSWNDWNEFDGSGDEWSIDDWAAWEARDWPAALSEEVEGAYALASLNTHIRFPSTPLAPSTVDAADAPGSASSAVAIAVACSGGGLKAVKKSKSKQRTAADADDGAPADESVVPKYMRDAAMLTSRVAVRQVGAHARAARSAARAETHLATEVVPALDLSDPAAAGPFPMLSAAASVAQRQAREVFEADRNERAALSAAAWAAEATVNAAADEAAALRVSAAEAGFEMRAEALRDIMFAEDTLHDALRQLPTTPAATKMLPKAPVEPKAGTKRAEHGEGRTARARSAGVKPAGGMAKPLVAPVKVVCVAAQADEEDAQE